MKTIVVLSSAHSASNESSSSHRVRASAAGLPRASSPKHTLPRTVRQANSDLLYSWKSSTKFGGGPVTSLPFTITRPALGAKSPAIDMSSVVLPQPEGPTNETNSPASTWQEISPIAIVVSPPTWRQLFDKLWTSRMATREDKWSVGMDYWNDGLMEYWIRNSSLRHSIVPVFSHAFGAMSLITSRALMAREINLYFSVKSTVTWTSFSDTAFSNSG